jgi:hypothetical protein
MYTFSSPRTNAQADLKMLGYFVDHNGCFRKIDAPEQFFDFFYTNNDRHNEVRGEAMRGRYTDKAWTSVR